MSGYRVELFGGLTVIHGDRSSERMDSRRAGALLAWLAYFPDRPHSRNALVEMLWPGVDETSGRASLRQALAAIRREAEEVGGHPDELVVATYTHVQLAPGVTTDVRDFERALAEAERAGEGPERIGLLRKAVDYYTGDLLTAFDEMWILGERRRHAEAALGALREVAHQLEASGEIEPAIDYALRAVAADTAREESHLAVMRLYVAAGQRAAALRQYKELERALKSQLDEEPSVEARALLEQVRREAGENGGASNGNHASSYRVKLARGPGSAHSWPAVATTPWHSALPRLLYVRLVAMVCIVAALVAADVALRWRAAHRPAPPRGQPAAAAAFKGRLMPGVRVPGRIVCQSDHDGQSDVCLLDTAAGTIRVLAEGRPAALAPNWSPDGKRVAFARQNGDGSYAISVINADGTGEHSLVTDVSGLEWPNWSPDGRRIVYCSARSGSWQICVMDADGSHQVRLTRSNSEVREVHPVWSPDGRQIAWSSQRPVALTSDLCVMSADGSKVRKLIAGVGREAANVYPAWSPDGRTIAFIHAEAALGGGWSVWSLQPDGRGLRRLTAAIEEALSPTWTPDGRYIVFSSSRTGNPELWIMRADGSDPQRITDTPAHEVSPSVR